MSNRLSILIVTVCCALAAAAEERVVPVRDGDQLRAAIADAAPGTRITIAPGTYAGGVNLRRVSGAEQAPIVIEAQDLKDPPLFQGGAVAFQLSDCNHVTLRHLRIDGQRANGLNIDDGGSFDTPSRHIVLENLTVTNVGPVGNRDAIKMSGVTDFVVRDCHIEGWGGQAVDMVGCHDGLIENCEFRGKKGFTQSAGPQTKGGSSRIVVRRCLFVGPMQRGVNIGGSTGMQFFRPIDAKYEAADITVEGCTFVGTSSPVAYVGVDGATVRFNTMYHPDDWALRILQENLHERLARSNGGRFENNLIVLTSPLREGAVNIGPNTRPQTFAFQGNWWYCDNDPAARPNLPTPEKDGIYGRDPKLRADDRGRLTLDKDSPATKVGAAAFEAPK